MEKIKALFFNYDWEIVEIQGATFKILWALFLLMPFPAFKTISGYASIGTENYWGSGLLIIGVLHMYSILIHKRWMRKLMTFISSLLWLFITFIVWQEAHTSALLVFFLTIGFFMFLNFLRLSIPVNQRVADQKLPVGMIDRRT